MSKTAVALRAPPPLTAEEAGAPLSNDGATVAPGAPSGRSLTTTLRNAEVLQMVGAGLGDAVIVQAIESARCEFDVTPGALVALKQAKTSDAVISAMIRVMK